MERHKMSWKQILKNQRPDYPDLDGDGDEEEPMIDALETVEQVESAKKSMEKFGASSVQCPVCGNMFRDNASHSKHHAEKHPGKPM